VTYAGVTFTGGAGTAGNPIDNAITPSTYDVWQSSTAVVGTEIAFDLGSAKAVDCAGVVAHNLFTAGMTVRVESSTTAISGPWTARSGIQTPTDDGTIMLRFNSASARYWRFVFTPVTGVIAPVVGHVMLGTAFRFPAGVSAPYTPLWQAQNYELLMSQTLNGQFVTNRVIRKGAETSISLVATDYTFVKNSLQPFRQHYNEGKPFLFAAGPLTWPEDVSYCWRKPGAEMKPTFNEDGIWMSVGMEVEGYVE
jgi:hypothetical protein